MGRVSTRDFTVCTATFGQKGTKLNSRPVYFSQIYVELQIYYICERFGGSPNTWTVKSTLVKVYLSNILQALVQRTISAKP